MSRWVALLPLLSIAAMLLGPLRRRHPDWAWPAIVELFFAAFFVCAAIAAVAACRQAMVLHRRMLAEADGDNR